MLISSHCQIPDGTLWKNYILKKSRIRATDFVKLMGFFHSSWQTMSHPNTLLTAKIRPINSCHGNLTKPNMQPLFNIERHIFNNVCKQCFYHWSFVQVWLIVVAFLLLSLRMKWHESVTKYYQKSTGLHRHEKGPLPNPSLVCTWKWTSTDDNPSDKKKKNL